MGDTNKKFLDYDGTKCLKDNIINYVDNSIPTSLPASDVSDWAKQETKPTYTASEVGALPADTEIPSITGLASETYVDNAISAINAVPACTTSDNDKILAVVNGVPTWISITNAEGVEY